MDALLAPPPASRLRDLRALGGKAAGHEPGPARRARRPPEAQLAAIAARGDRDRLRRPVQALRASRPRLSAALRLRGRHGRRAGAGGHAGGVAQGGPVRPRTAPPRRPGSSPSRATCGSTRFRRRRSPTLAADMVDAPSDEPGPDEQLAGAPGRRPASRGAAELPPEQVEVIRAAYFADFAAQRDRRSAGVAPRHRQVASAPGPAEAARPVREVSSERFPSSRRRQPARLRHRQAGARRRADRRRPRGSLSRTAPRRSTFLERIGGALLEARSRRRSRRRAGSRASPRLDAPAPPRAGRRGRPAPRSGRTPHRPLALGRPWGSRRLAERRAPGKASSCTWSRCAPGAKFPEHGHQGVERVVVLQGAFIDGDERFGPGDLWNATTATATSPSWLLKATASAWSPRRAACACRAWRGWLQPHLRDVNRRKTGWRCDPPAERLRKGLIPLSRPVASYESSARNRDSPQTPKPSTSSAAASPFTAPSPTRMKSSSSLRAGRQPPGRQARRSASTESACSWSPGGRCHIRDLGDEGRQILGFILPGDPVGRADSRDTPNHRAIALTRVGLVDATCWSARRGPAPARASPQPCRARIMPSMGATSTTRCGWARSAPTGRCVTSSTSSTTGLPPSGWPAAAASTSRSPRTSSETPWASARCTPTGCWPRCAARGSWSSARARPPSCRPRAEGSALALAGDRRQMAGMPDAPVLARLHDRALVAVRGPDWRSFLQGLVTQDVETLGRRAALRRPADAAGAAAVRPVHPRPARTAPCSTWRRRAATPSSSACRCTGCGPRRRWSAAEGGVFALGARGQPLAPGSPTRACRRSATAPTGCSNRAESRSRRRGGLRRPSPRARRARSGARLRRRDHLSDRGQPRPPPRHRLQEGLLRRPGDHLAHEAARADQEPHAAHPLRRARPCAGSGGAGRRRCAPERCAPPAAAGAWR